MIDKEQDTFNSAVVFSGGGTRFALYVGMYAALVEMGKRPDLIIASCGGSVAAAVIRACSEIEEQKAYLKSKEFYDFVIQTKLTGHKSIFKIGYYSFLKTLHKTSAPYIEDVFDRYLVEMPQDLTELLPTLKQEQNNSPKIIVIGSKMLFEPIDISLKRGERKLYQKVLFTDEETQKKIAIAEIEIQSDNYIRSAVAKEILTDSSLPLHQAMRISISDMFYVAPVKIRQDYYAGGAIDLVPIELAQSLAKEVFLERKQSYKSVEEALVRAVLGFNGNERLREVEAKHTGYWIDTQDAPQVLKGYYCAKYIDWFKGEIRIQLPDSFEKFQEDIEQQWQYGYQRTLDSLRK
ncbi:patatin-like phospholipase family protein [Sphingobacterium sp. SRCM116780]|uniref:patatin-like phospholipase family protein n=1 Tax=Sphingobacterium sp. SRCM116780 TaxID=2907623 RepID=UPI001F19D064|nr:patatin-like phospholipase family protein [Sphingobacterium sp. SRCM116780]UIR55501.1 patatin-like phospholipase family protein [Sphingobacterium sp. SRCM116780]